MQVVLISPFSRSPSAFVLGLLSLLKVSSPREFSPYVCTCIYMAHTSFQGSSHTIEHTDAFQRRLPRFSDNNYYSGFAVRLTSPRIPSKTYAHDRGFLRISL